MSPKDPRTPRTNISKNSSTRQLSFDILVREDAANIDRAMISAIVCFWRHCLLDPKNNLPKSCTVENDNFGQLSWYQVEKAGSEVLF